MRRKAVTTNSHILVEAFDTAVAERLTPFFVALGGQHSAGEACYDGSSAVPALKALPYEELDGRFFWWINRFTVGGTTLDIAYGDREFLIQASLSYAGIAHHFAPWELLQAAQAPNPLAVSGGDWLFDPGSIARVVEEFAEGIRQHWSILGTADPRLIDRACVLRGERMLVAQAEQRRIDRERASIQASAAFHAGRYAEAIRLLEPFRDDAELARSSKKLLELAESRLR